MNHYYCNLCNFYSDHKANYERHLKTKKHQTISTKLGENAKKLAKVSQKKNNYSCLYCNKEYKHRSSLSKHIKYNCEKNKDEDLKELVRLMNLQIQQKDNQINNMNRQIEKLTEKLQVNHITNNTMNIHNNIQLLSYNDTDVSHLTNKDYVNSIKKVTFCVKHIIEKIHFNPDKPENMNIYISNMKDKYIMVYENGVWVLKNKSLELDNLYERKEMLLSDWLNEYGTPELHDKFERYLNNKEKDENMNLIKEEIKLMMYNKKRAIENG